MPTRAIVCLSCDNEGEIEVQNLENDVPPSKIFKYRGHNPYSGDMHYECPSCKIVLLADPMAVLGEETICGYPHFLLSERKGREYGPSLPQEYLYLWQDKTGHGENMLKRV